MQGVIDINEVERRLQLQAIYEEIENSPPEEKVREYFKSVPYHLRKRVKAVAPVQQEGVKT